MLDIEGAGRKTTTSTVGEILGIIAEDQSGASVTSDVDVLDTQPFRVPF